MRTTAWAAFTAAETALDAALRSLDADAILNAAAGLHSAAADLVAPGQVRDEAMVADALEAALRRIESCRLRVMFLADHGGRRVASLTPPSANPVRWRPDRAA